MLVLFIPCAFFSDELFTLVALPLMEKMPQGTSMIATSLVSPFMAPLKLALFVALFLAMPFVLYQVWAFVAPGLYRREKRFAIPLLVSSILLFYAGVAFAYFVVFPLMFGFLTTTAPTGVQVMTDIDELPGFRAAAVLRVRHRVRDSRRHRAARATGLVRVETMTRIAATCCSASSWSRRSSRRPMRSRKPSWPCRCSCSMRSGIVMSRVLLRMRRERRSAARKKKPRRAERAARRVELPRLYSHLIPTQSAALLPPRTLR